MEFFDISAIIVALFGTIVIGAIYECALYGCRRIRYFFPLGTILKFVSLSIITNLCINIEILLIFAIVYLRICPTIWPNIDMC